MAQAEESDSRGIAVASSEPKPEFKCSRCARIFQSAPALCGHQNAHRPVREPMRMSPILAAVLNNPLPPDDKPVLIPPVPEPGAGPTRVQELVSKQPVTAGNVSPRYHPYMRLHKKPAQDNFMEEEVTSYNTPHRKPEEKDLLRQLLERDPYQYHPYEMVLPEYSEEYSLPQRFTMDLLGEWMPLSGFGDHGELATSSGQTISDPVLRNYSMEGRDGHHQTGSMTSTGHLDLELKLGF